MVFGYRIGGAEEDLALDDRDSARCVPKCVVVDPTFDWGDDSSPNVPWNDTIVHHYVFTLYALDVAKCPLQGNFKGPEVLNAIQGHVLGSATLTGVYSLNPSVSP